MGEFCFSPFLCINFHALLDFCWHRRVLIFFLKLFSSAVNSARSCRSAVPGVAVEGGYLTCKGGGWEVAEYWAWGRGESHSVDPQSVTSLKRESGERTHRAKVQEAAWRSQGSKRRGGGEHTVKQSHRGASQQKTSEAPKFFSWTCPEWSPTTLAKVRRASVYSASAAEKKEMTTGCRAGGKVIQVEGRQREF